MDKILAGLTKDEIYERGPFKKSNQISTTSPLKMSRKIIKGYLGDSHNKIRVIHEYSMTGVINGMYATESGQGGILPIQIYPNIMPNENNKFTLEMTGRQQEVMRESIRVALTPAERIINPKILKEYYKENKNGFHIHTPSASVPKDGPSAGCAFATAYVSVFLNKKIRNDISMTGEIDSTGKISAIGGLRYKLTGAKRAGVKLVFVPKDNKEDVDKIKKEDSGLIDGKNFKVKYVDYLIDVINEAIIDLDTDSLAN